MRINFLLGFKFFYLSLYLLLCLVIFVISFFRIQINKKQYSISVSFFSFNISNGVSNENDKGLAACQSLKGFKTGIPAAKDGITEW